MNRADDLRREAEEYLKTGFWKRRKPDHLNAAPLFEKAAVAARASGDLAGSVELYELASTSHYEIGAPFSSAQTTAFSFSLSMFLLTRIGRNF